MIKEEKYIKQTIDLKSSTSPTSCTKWPSNYLQSSPSSYSSVLSGLPLPIIQHRLTTLILPVYSTTAATPRDCDRPLYTVKAGDTCDSIGSTQGVSKSVNIVASEAILIPHTLNPAGSCSKSTQKSANIVNIFTLARCIP